MEFADLSKMTGEPASSNNSLNVLSVEVASQNVSEQTKRKTRSSENDSKLGSGNQKSGNCVSHSSHAAVKANMKSEMAKRWLRVVTVLLYMVFVSISGVALSLYYLFFWTPELAGHARNHANTTMAVP